MSVASKEGCCIAWDETPCPWTCRFKEVMAKAPKEYTDYAKCMDYYTLDVRKCEEEKKAFEQACPWASFKKQ